MIDKDILNGLTTERSKRAYKRLCAAAEGSMEKLAASVKKRHELSWSEEFAMRCQLEAHKLEHHRNAVTTALQVEFLEVQMQAIVATIAAEIQERTA